MEGEITETSLSNVGNAVDKTKTSYDFEIVLEYIGQMGKYQTLLAIFLIYSTIPIGMDAMSIVFLFGIPQHRCHIPGVDGNPKYINYSFEYLLNISTPFTDEGYDGCALYDQNYTRCLDEENRDWSDPGSDQSVTSCESYVYGTDFGKTIVTEWNLVCDRLILGTTSNSVYFSGALVGCLFSGNISDNIGRRYVLLICTILTVASGIACAFASTLIMVTAMRFILSMANGASFSVGFVYVTEILGEKWRVIVGAAYNTVFAVGYTLLSMMAYFWTDWRHLQLALALVSAPFLLMWIMIPESPRWLFAKGRASEGKRVSRVIATRNGSSLPRDIWSKSLLKSEDHRENKQYHSTVTLFRRSGVRGVTFVLMLCFFIVAMVYLGLSLNVGMLAGNLYVNNALSGIAEIVAGPIAAVIAKQFGRRLTMIVSFIVSGLLCISSSIANHNASDSSKIGMLATSLAICGKLTISTAYDILYIYVSEVYPTVVRASALSTVSTCSLVASVITPYMLHLQYYFSWLPGVIFGVLSIIAALACLRLKETQNQKMMTTLAEAENFYKV